MALVRVPLEDFGARLPVAGQRLQKKGSNGDVRWFYYYRITLFPRANRLALHSVLPGTRGPMGRRDSITAVIFESWHRVLIMKRARQVSSNTHN